MDKLKQALLKSPQFVALYEGLFQRPLRNYYGRAHAKKALFVYSTYHFKKKKFVGHSNYQESHVITELLDLMGYSVDIINNHQETTLPLEGYDLIIGEGLPLYQAREARVRAKVVYYATGSHPWHCSSTSQARLEQFFRARRFLASASTRLQDPRWGTAANLADAIICIGNDQTRKTFVDAGTDPADIYLVNPTFHQNSEVVWGQRDIGSARKSALWLGSYGLLHKGLDLAVEAARARPDWTLHVCGHTAREAAFVRALEAPPNVHIHGFMNIESSAFTDIALACQFVMLPSCSEGIATSVITAMGRAGMIPMVTAACGVDTGDYGVPIDTVSTQGVLRAMAACDALSLEALAQMSGSAASVAHERYSMVNYRATMQEHLAAILENA